MTYTAGNNRLSKHLLGMCIFLQQKRHLLCSSFKGISPSEDGQGMKPAGFESTLLGSPGTDRVCMGRERSNIQSRWVDMITAIEDEGHQINSEGLAEANNEQVGPSPDSISLPLAGRGNCAGASLLFMLSRREKRGGTRHMRSPDRHCYSRSLSFPVHEAHAHLSTLIHT